MLIEFRVENFRSLRDEQVITFEAATIGDETDLRPRTVSGHDKKLLPAAVLYGANASGKTNMLAALGFMREAVMFSHRVWRPEGGIDRTPFAWGEKRSSPSFYEVSFLIAGTKYTYGFVVSDKAVEEEWLHAWPNGRKQVWFEREDDEFKFGEHLEGPNGVIQEVTRSNALFLSVAAQHNHRQLVKVQNWFLRTTTFNLKTKRITRRIVPNRFNVFYTQNAQEISKPFLTLLRAADKTIVKYKVVVENDEPSLNSRRYFFQHKATDESSWLELGEESLGTRAVFILAAPILTALEHGSLLLVDELESSLHPLLGQAMVQLFNNPITNPKNAQIVFTTHDTNLLGNTIGDPILRRDQIWLAEKDSEGASEIYPLTDYKPRKAENLERGYLQGRYGAIPFLTGLARIAE